MPEIITLCEYEPLYNKKDGNLPDDVKAICDEEFQAIWELSKEFDTRDDYETLIKFRRQKGHDVIIPQNYVGTISFKNGTSLEILPKIAAGKNPMGKYPEIRKLFYKMLSLAYDLPFISTDRSKQSVDDGLPYEFYIRVFLNEVDNLIKTGLASSYSYFEGNMNCIKGKPLFIKNIKINYAHAERFYCKYNVFSIDRAENRVIKAALKHLFGLSKNAENRRRINAYLPFFDNVGDIGDLDFELNSCINERNTLNYDMALKFSEIFLRNQTITTFKGSMISYTFLFPMNDLFEKYVAKKIKPIARKHNCICRIQCSKPLFYKGDRRLFLKPDILIEKNGKRFIIDTKWKILCNHKDVSRDDIYQMFAYSMCFHADNVLLLYPCYDRDLKTNMKGKVPIFMDDGKCVEREYEINAATMDLFDDMSLDKIFSTLIL